MGGKKVLIRNTSFSDSVYRKITENIGDLHKSLEKISFGKLTRSAEDPAGLAIASTWSSELRSLNTAMQNIQDGISISQTASGGAEKILDLLHRTRELVIRAGSEILSPSDLEAIQREIVQLRDEIDHIAINLEFNTIILLNGDGSTRASPDTDASANFQRGSTEVFSGTTEVGGGTSEEYSKTQEIYTTAQASTENFVRIGDETYIKPSDITFQRPAPETYTFSGQETQTNRVEKSGVGFTEEYLHPHEEGVSYWDEIKCKKVTYGHKVDTLSNTTETFSVVDYGPLFRKDSSAQVGFYSMYRDNYTTPQFYRTDVNEASPNTVHIGAAPTGEFQSTQRLNHPNNIHLDISKNFANAGYLFVPGNDNTVTIGSWESELLGNYGSIIEFRNAVTANSGATLSYDSTTDRYTITNNTGIPINLQDNIVSGYGFFQTARIDTSTPLPASSSRTSSAQVVNRRRLDTSTGSIVVWDENNNGKVLAPKHPAGDYAYAHATFSDYGTSPIRIAATRYYYPDPAHSFPNQKYPTPTNGAAPNFSDIVVFDYSPHFSDVTQDTVSNQQLLNANDTLHLEGENVQLKLDKKPNRYYLTDNTNKSIEVRRKEDFYGSWQIVPRNNTHGYSVSENIITLHGDYQIKEADDLIQVQYGFDHPTPTQDRGTTEDDIFEMRLSEIPELYNYLRAVNFSPKSIKVYVGGVEIPYDQTYNEADNPATAGLGGWYFAEDQNPPNPPGPNTPINPDVPYRTIRIVGTRRPNFNESIAVHYVRDIDASANSIHNQSQAAENVPGSPNITGTISQDSVLVLKLPIAPALYNYWDPLEHPRSIRVYKGSVEIPHISNDNDGTNDGWKLVRIAGSTKYNGIAIFGNPDDSNWWKSIASPPAVLSDPRPDATDTITIDYVADYTCTGLGGHSIKDADYNPGQVPTGSLQKGTPIRMRLRYEPEVYNVIDPQDKKVSIRVFRQNPDNSWQEIFHKTNDSSGQDDGFNLVDTNNNNRVDTIELHGNAYNDTDQIPYTYTYSGATGPPATTSASDPRPDATDTKAVRIYYQTDYDQGSNENADQGGNVANESHQGSNDYNIDIKLKALPENYYNNDQSVSSIRVYVQEGGTWREIPRDETHTNGWDLVKYDGTCTAEFPGQMQHIRIFGNNQINDQRPDAGNPTAGTTKYRVEYHRDYPTTGSTNQNKFIDIDLTRFPELHDVARDPDYASKTIRVYYLDGTEDKNVIRQVFYDDKPDTDSTANGWRIVGFGDPRGKVLRIRGNKALPNTGTGMGRYALPNVSRIATEDEKWIRIKYHTDYKWDKNQNKFVYNEPVVTPAGTSRQDGEVDLEIGMIPELNRPDASSPRRTIHVYKDGTRIPYFKDTLPGFDLRDKNDARSGKETISFLGSSNPDIATHTNLEVRYHTDYQENQTKIDANQDGFVDVRLRLSAYPELNRTDPTTHPKSIRVEVYTSSTGQLEEIPWNPAASPNPNVDSGWNLVQDRGSGTVGSGSEEFGQTGPNRWIRIYGNSAPDPTPDSSTTAIRISYVTDYQWNDTSVPANQNNCVDVKLRYLPELNAGTLKRTISVETFQEGTGLVTIPWDGAHSNGWDLVNATGGNTAGSNQYIRIYGASCPDARITDVGQPVVRITYHTDYNSAGQAINANQDNEVDLSLSSTPETVVNSAGQMRTIRIISGTREVNYNSGAGYTLKDKTAVPKNETIGIKGNESPLASESSIKVSYHTDYDFTSLQPGKWVNANQDGEIDIALRTSPEVNSVGTTVSVVGNGVSIPYDPNPPLNGWDVSGNNLRISGDNTPGPGTITVKYHTDYSTGSLEEGRWVSADQDRKVEILLPNPPDVAIGTARKTVRVYAYSGDSPDAATDEIPYSDNRTNGWNIDNDPANPNRARTIAIYGNPTPGPTPDRPKLRVVYHTGYQHPDSVLPDPDQTDKALGVKVGVIPELYSYGATRSVRVYVGSGAAEREVPYDPTNTNGWNIHPTDKKVINLYGDAAPDTSESRIRVEYHCDYKWNPSAPDRRINADQDENVQITLSTTAAAYPGALSVKLVDSTGNESSVPEHPTNGWSWADPTKTKITLRGTYRPDPIDHPTIRVFTNIFSLTKRPEIYNLGTPDTPKSIRVWRGTSVNPYQHEQPYDPTNGFQYDPATNKIILCGTAIPQPGQIVTVKYTHDWGNESNQNGLLEAVLKDAPLDYGDLGTEKVRVNGGANLTQDGPNGYTLSNRTITLMGTGRLDANQIGDAQEDLRVEHTTAADNTFTVDLSSYYQSGYHLKISNLNIVTNGVAVPPEGYSTKEDLTKPLPGRSFTFRLEGDWRLVGNRGADPGVKGHNIVATFRYAQYKTNPWELDVHYDVNSGDIYTIDFDPLNTIDLEVQDIDVTSATPNRVWLERLDSAIEGVINELTDFGADQNVFERTLKDERVRSENLQRAVSKVTDTDYAKEILKKTTAQIGIEVGMAALAHGDIKPDAVHNVLSSATGGRAFMGSINVRISSSTPQVESFGVKGMSTIKGRYPRLNLSSFRKKIRQVSPSSLSKVKTSIPGGNKKLSIKQRI